MLIRCPRREREVLLHDFEATNPGLGGFVGPRGSQPGADSSSFRARLELGNQLCPVNEMTGTNLSQGLSQLPFILGREPGELRSQAKDGNRDSLLEVPGYVDLAVDDLGGQYFHALNPTTAIQDAAPRQPALFPFTGLPYRRFCNSVPGGQHLPLGSRGVVLRMLGQGLDFGRGLDHQMELLE